MRILLDDNLPDQQHLELFDLAIVILRARSKERAVLAELIPEVERSLPVLAPGEVKRIHPPSSDE